MRVTVPPRALLLSLLLLAWAAPGARADEARWIRYAAVAPDGASVAFAYRGDLWVVSTGPGPQRARALTRHPAYDRSPVWSPDGQTIAFASDRHGNFDVFRVPAAGGAATRLTWHSANDIPSGFSPDGTQVLVQSRRQDAPGAIVPSLWMSELYLVPTAGGRARQILTTPAGDARFNADATQILYTDLRGYENPWRKHQTSSVARDLRIVDLASGAHRRLTTYRGEDRDGVFGPGGTTIFYLSERSGSFNVWRRAADGTGAPVQVTRHTTYPVRFLSIAGDGTLAYTLHGELYVLAPGGTPRKVQVEVPAEPTETASRWLSYRDGATEMAVAPSGEEVAFVVRGDVFVASVKRGTTRAVTKTPFQERHISWAPDGRSIYYAAEVDGSWSLFRSVLGRKDEERFHLATIIEREPVLVDANQSFHPRVSPDGKQIAYIHERDEIRVLDPAKGTTMTIVPAARNYSYSDGDIDFRWSPDSRWLAFTYLPHHRWIEDIGIADVETGAITNVTRSGYSTVRPRFGADGRALLFSTTRYGRRNHGGWGSDADISAFDLNRAAHDRALLSPEDFERLRDQEQKQDDAEDPGKDAGEDDDEKPKPKPKKGDGDSAKPKPKQAPKPIEVDRADPEQRIRRLTMHSAPLGDFALSRDGEALLTLSEMDGVWGVWLTRRRDSETRKLLDLGPSRPKEIAIDAKGKRAFVLTGDGGILSMKLGGALDKGGNRLKQKSVPFHAELTLRPAAERRYLFEHVWRQVQRKFYDPGLHGVDWSALRTAYESRLADVETGRGFAELLSEMLGELNASHTGAGWRPKQRGGDRTASLGLLYDTLDKGPGLRIAEVLAEGPCARATSSIAAGQSVVAIDGVLLSADRAPSALLNRRAGQRVRLTLQKPDDTRFEEVIKPISLDAERGLLYKRWVRRSRAQVEKESGGRLGYVHVRSMGDASFRVLYEQAIGRYADAEALVVDTRFNGGGWLHDDLVKFFEARPYLWPVPRGKRRGDLGREPASRWSKPSIVVMSEGNYSDAHIFPFAYKALGLGKLVGAPVAGTGTAVWWERLMDGETTFGIPEVGMMDKDGHYVENQELEPDVLVLLGPEDMARGRDTQLSAAVRTLLEDLK